MQNEYTTLSEEITSQTEQENSLTPAPPFDLKMQVYADTKQALHNFSETHPGFGKKFFGFTLLGAAVAILMA